MQNSNARKLSGTREIAQKDACRIAPEKNVAPTDVAGRAVRARRRAVAKLVCVGSASRNAGTRNAVLAAVAECVACVKRATRSAGSMGSAGKQAAPDGQWEDATDAPVRLAYATQNQNVVRDTGTLLA